MIVDSEQVIDIGYSNENIDGKQRPILGYDDQRVSRPNDSSCSQRSSLSRRNPVSRTSEISNRSNNQTPFEGRSPEEDGFRSCRMFPKRTKTVRDKLLSSSNQGSIDYRHFDSDENHKTNEQQNKVNVKDDSLINDNNEAVEGSSPDLRKTDSSGNRNMDKTFGLLE